jgi:hypothetical protein
VRVVFILMQLQRGRKERDGEKGRDWRIRLKFTLNK